MTDEQIIYLSPEEELTNVRERLERAQAKRIILVIPLQTQLRSHVAWRLLYSRTRELGKDVLVISSDRQIRSVAKVAGFRVADSQESTPSGGTRPGSRPSRAGLGGKTAGRVRSPLSKGTPDRGSSTDIRIRPREQPARHSLPADEQRMTSEERESRIDDTSASTITNPPSSTPGVPGKQYGPEYDYRIEPSPPKRPVELEPEYPEYDESDLLLGDYQVAQRIRESAQQDDTVTKPPQGQVQTGKTPTRNELSRDPFALMEDIQPVPLPEQRGAASVDEFDEGVPDIADYPTDVLGDGEIEDLGDEGDIVQPRAPSPRPWAKPVFEEPEIAESSRVYGVRPRSNRQGNIPQDVESEDALPPIQDQPTRTIPPPSPPPAATPVAGSRVPGPQPLVPPRTRTPARTPTTQQGPRHPGPGRSATAAQSTRKPAARRGGRGILLAVASILISLFIVGSALAIFGPTADVTITIPSQSFSTPLMLTATATSRQDAQLHTVAGRTVIFDTSVTGTGPATGSKKVGTAPATGNIVFTNKGTQPVEIPTGTIVATSKGVQFATMADVLVPAIGSNVGNTTPAPIQAQSAGESGNVPANSITAIPSESLSKIAQANNTSSVNLTVTNPDAITNGGVGNAASVTAKDITTVKGKLDQQLQQQVNEWLARQVHDGDAQGKPIQMETVVATPAEGQVATSGTFTERVSLHMTVLVVRAADIQAVAQMEFNAAANNHLTGYALVPQQMLSLAKTTSKTCTPASSATSLTLCFTATGQIAPQIPEQQIRNGLAGKTVQDAQRYLTSITNSVSGTTAPVISVHPGFFPWLPFWSQHINVHFKLQPRK